MTVAEDVRGGAHLGQAVINHEDEQVSTEQLVAAIIDISQIPSDVLAEMGENFEDLIRGGKGSRIMPGQKLNPPKIS